MKNVAATSGHKVSFCEFFGNEAGRETEMVGLGRCSSVEVANSYGVLLRTIENFDPGQKEYKELDSER